MNLHTPGSHQSSLKKISDELTRQGNSMIGLGSNKKNPEANRKVDGTKNTKMSRFSKKHCGNLVENLISRRLL